MSEEKAKKKEKPKRKVFSATGLLDNILYESIFLDGHPAFLAFNIEAKKFMVVPNLPEEETVFMPLDKHRFPYRPYNFTETTVGGANTWKPSLSYLYEKVYAEFDTFLDLEPKYKVLNTIMTLQTYQQHKLMTTAYLYHYGPNISGKTRDLEIHNFLDYRPLFSISLPSADVYSYLGWHSEAQGTILEDEAERLNKDRDKLKIYKSGYRKGATCPRIEFTRSGTRIQRFFKAFCCKVFAGLWVPNDKGFQQRCIEVPMFEGYPKKDEILEEDLKRFDDLRVLLLVWRMRTFFDVLPTPNLSLRGRMRELWKPLFQTAYGLPAEKILHDLATEELRKREEELSTQFEAYLTRAVVKAYVLYGHKEVPFKVIWDTLKTELEGTDVDDKAIDSKLFGEVSKRLVGFRLKSVLHGERHLRRKSGRTYSFEKEMLSRAIRKFRLGGEYQDTLKTLEFVNDVNDKTIIRGAVSNGKNVE